MLSDRCKKGPRPGLLTLNPRALSVHRGFAKDNRPHSKPNPYLPEPIPGRRGPFLQTLGRLAAGCHPLSRSLNGLAPEPPHTVLRFIEASMLTNA